MGIYTLGLRDAYHMFLQRLDTVPTPSPPKKEKRKKFEKRLRRHPIQTPQLQIRRHHNPMLQIQIQLINRLRRIHPRAARHSCFVVTDDTRTVTSVRKGQAIFRQAFERASGPGIFVARVRLLRFDFAVGVAAAEVGGEEVGQERTHGD